MKFIIGLAGFAGTGKDTVRTILEEYGFSGFAFADPLRAMIRELLSSGGFDHAYMDDRGSKEKVIPGIGFSYRELMQTLGTSWGRGLRDDLWLQFALAKMAALRREKQTCSFVISDVRFANEEKFVREHGGVIWRVQRDSATPVRQHQSEIEVSSLSYDQLIYNNGSLADLREVVEESLKVIA